MTDCIHFIINHRLDIQTIALLVWMSFLSFCLWRIKRKAERNYAHLLMENDKNQHSSYELNQSLIDTKNFCHSECAELSRNQDSLNQRIDVLEDHDLENSKEYSGLLSEVTSLIQQHDESSKHAFYLRVANEILRIQNNLNYMGTEVKGYKQLLKCYERLKDAMLADGYEFVELQDRPYVEGMNVTASFMDDDTVEPGKSIIKKISVPQVNYKGELLQTATVVVAQNID